MRSVRAGRQWAAMIAGVAGRGETIELRGAGGIRLEADVWGDPGAPPVLLWHGGGQTRHSWGRTAAILGEQGWRAMTIDLRGHGGSDWAPDGDYRLEAFCADLTTVVRGLDDRPALVGASLGGVASLAAVGGGVGAAPKGAPLARSLVLVDVAPRIEDAGRDRITAFMLQHAETGFGSLEDVADAIAAYNPHRPRPSDLGGLAKNVRQRPDGRWAWHWDPRFLQAGHAHEGESRVSLMAADRLEHAARALRLPTLLIRGQQSDLLSEEGARRFLSLVPHAEFVDVEGAGHMIAGDRNDLFNDAVTEFLNRQRDG